MMPLYSLHFNALWNYVTRCQLEEYKGLEVEGENIFVSNWIKESDETDQQLINVVVN